MTPRQPPGAEPVAIWIARTDAHASAREIAAAMLVRMADELAGVRASLARDETGRPRLSAAVPLDVSVSHCRGYVATALSRVGPVGVDVETRRDVPALALAARWFDASETQWLRARPEAERSAAFLRLWTRKEAAGKALGLGLRGGGMRRLVGCPDGAPSLTFAVPPQAPRFAIAEGQRDRLLLAVAGTDHRMPGVTASVQWDSRA